MTQPTTLEQELMNIVDTVQLDGILRYKWNTNTVSQLLSLFEKYAMEVIGEEWDVNDIVWRSHQSILIYEQTARLKQIVKGTQDTQ